MEYARDAFELDHLGGKASVKRDEPRMLETLCDFAHQPKSLTGSLREATAVMPMAHVGQNVALIATIISRFGHHEPSGSVINPHQPLSAS